MYIIFFEIISRTVIASTSKNFDIFNVCSNKPLHLKKIIKFVENKIGKIKIKVLPYNEADVLKTHGNNHKIKKFIKYKKFSNFDLFFNKTFEWYKKNKIYKF